MPVHSIGGIGRNLLDELRYIGQIGKGLQRIKELKQARGKMSEGVLPSGDGLLSVCLRLCRPSPWWTLPTLPCGIHGFVSLPGFIFTRGSCLFLYSLVRCFGTGEYRLLSMAMTIWLSRTEAALA
jgi:hypothetical protein